MILLISLLIKQLTLLWKRQIVILTHKQIHEGPFEHTYTDYNFHNGCYALRTNTS